MGLTTFEGDFPTKKDIKVAKNYLSETELKVLNNLVSAYFDLAEINAMEHKTMYMADYVEQLDKILSGTGKDVLEGAGSVSHKQALEKAEKEYKKYIQKNLSPVEKAYLETIKNLNEVAMGGAPKAFRSE